MTREELKKAYLEMSEKCSALENKNTALEKENADLRKQNEDKDLRIEHLSHAGKPGL